MPNDGVLDFKNDNTLNDEDFQPDDKPQGEEITQDTLLKVQERLVHDIVHAKKKTKLNNQNVSSSTTTTHTTPNITNTTCSSSSFLQRPKNNSGSYNDNSNNLNNSNNHSIIQQLQFLYPHVEFYKNRFDRIVPKSPHCEIIDNLMDIHLEEPELNQNDLAVILGEFYQRYVVEEERDTSRLRLRAFGLMGIENVLSVHLEDLEKERTRNNYQIHRLYFMMTKFNMTYSFDNANIQHLEKFRKILTMIDVCFNVIYYEVKALGVQNSDLDINVSIDTMLLKPSCLDYRDNNETQTLIIYLLNELYKHGYRRYKGKVYGPIRVKDPQTGKNYNTHAWKEISDILTFVLNRCNKTTTFNMWRMLTSKSSNQKTVVDYLSQCTHDDEFKELKPNRHVFSFFNGIYVANENKFYYYNRDTIDDSLVACKFFNKPLHYDEFEHNFRDNPWDIPTPAFQSILDYQGFGKKTPTGQPNKKRFIEAGRVLYMSLGRLLYKLNEMDHWQYIPFIKGVAGSGKSTIAKVAKNFYDIQDIGIMSSNAEEKFGLQALYDKFIYICLEVKKKFGIPQSELQSTIVGEPMSIPVKNKVAIQLEWDVPGIFFGNEVANWIDASGSMSRRLLVWAFERAVLAKDADSELDTKLNQEMPQLLYKCNRIYLYYQQRHKEDLIWKFCGQYLSGMRKKIMAQIQPLVQFLDENKSEIVCYNNENLCIRLKDFKAMFKNFCSNVNVPPPTFTYDLYSQIFEQRGIRIEYCERYCGGSHVKDEFVINVGTRELANSLEIPDNLDEKHDDDDDEDDAENDDPKVENVNQNVEEKQIVEDHIIACVDKTDTDKDQEVDKVKDTEDNDGSKDNDDDLEDDIC